MNQRGNLAFDFEFESHTNCGVSILGSTGSVGRQALDVIEALSGRFHVIGLTAKSNLMSLARQVRKFRPEIVGLSSRDQEKEFLGHLKEEGLKTAQYPEVVFGIHGLNAVSTHPEARQIVVSIVGIAALLPVLSALDAGKRVALANKECLVAAGHLVVEAQKRGGGSILPVDSELSAIFQCLQAGSKDEVQRIILTASGGPFLNYDAEALSQVTPEQTLRHPTWKMGKRITVDSATLMNKGFEVIETRWLFDFPVEQIDVVIHPESIVHSIVEYKDGSQIAQMGVPDMRLPIQYALTYPERVEATTERLDLASVGRMTFEEVDFDRFPCLKIAYEAAGQVTTLPAAINAADEVLVEQFLAGRIGFMDIPRIIEIVRAEHKTIESPSLAEVMEADSLARLAVRRAIAG